MSQVYISTDTCMHYLVCMFVYLRALYRYAQTYQIWTSQISLSVGCRILRAASIFSAFVLEGSSHTWTHNQNGTT